MGLVTNKLVSKIIFSCSDIMTNNNFFPTLECTIGTLLIAH